VTEINIEAEGERTFLDAYFEVNLERAAPLLQSVYQDGDFLRLREFFRTLAEALGRVEDSEIDEATQSDLTWEGNISGSLIDFAEWRANNLSASGASRLSDATEHHLGLPDGLLSNSGSLHLYVRYLKRAANE
jgi:hypothetical protein